MKLRPIGLFLILHALSAPAHAFEEVTHVEFTNQAYNRSILVTDPDLLRRLGLEANPSFPASSGKSLTITGLLQKGVVDEDTGIRAINHFFDPTRAGQANNGALVIIPGITPSFVNSSPTWALEDTTPAIQLQDSSWHDARKAFLDALKTDLKIGRDLAFGRMFESLGHVIHHPQDMAQPQHVRNDDHCNLPQCQPFLHRPSKFELYARQAVGRIDGFVSSANYAPAYDPTSPGPINSPRKFWSTGDGKGIAEFTNRNFVSARTNFRSENGTALPYVCFDSPAPSASTPFTITEAYAAVLGREVPPQILNFCGVGSACDVDVFATAGQDLLTGQPINNGFASSASVFDEDLQFLPTNEKPLVFDLYCNRTYTPERIFTLNRLNHEAALSLLAPRAVGYSAGMLNYFFRGKLGIGTIPSDPFGQYLLNPNPEAMSGTFSVYYEAVDGRRRQLQSPITISLPAAGPGGPTQGRSLTLPEPRPLFQVEAKRPLKYTLIFNGTLGEERTGPNEPVGAVVTRQVGVVYSPFVVTEPDYFGGLRDTALQSFAGGPRPDEAAVEAALVQDVRAQLSASPFGTFGCGDFTYTWGAYVTIQIKFPATPVELLAERLAPMQFPDSCSFTALQGAKLFMARRHKGGCAQGNIQTDRGVEPPIEEFCYTLQ